MNGIKRMGMEEGGVSTSELGYKYALTLQLDRINQARSVANNHGSFEKQSKNIYDYESHVGALEDSFAQFCDEDSPECDKDYTRKLNKARETINEEFNEKLENEDKFAKKEALELERIMRTAIKKYRLIIMLLSRKGLLLEREGTEII